MLRLPTFVDGGGWNITTPVAIRTTDTKGTSNLTTRHPLGHITPIAALGGWRSESIEMAGIAGTEIAVERYENCSCQQCGRKQDHKSIFHAVLLRDRAPFSKSRPFYRAVRPDRCNRCLHYVLCADSNWRIVPDPVKIRVALPAADPPDHARRS